jgi:hypothetical protein
MTTKPASGNQSNQLQPPPAMQDLIDTLERAVAHKEAHASAQTAYFLEAHGKTGNAPLQSCGTACCVAGDIALRHALDKGFIDPNAFYVDIEDLGDFLAHYQVDNPWDYVQFLCNLSNFEAHLLFSAKTHYTVHAYMAKLFREGYRIGGDWMWISQGSYLNFEPVILARANGKGGISCTDVQTPEGLMCFLDTLKVKIQEAEA